MSVNSSDLVKLYPLDKLRAENLEQLAREASSDEAGRGAVLFQAGASDDEKLETGSAVVAYLVRGDTFGEDALLASTLRNATVTMIKDGKLMRLAKKAFEEVMKPPAVDWLSPGMASIMARQGAVVVDVRMQEEHARRAIKDAISAPLYTLREAVVKFDKSKKYIVYCNTGERSAAAAFILGKLGFEVYALQGGISGMIRQIERKT